MESALPRSSQPGQAAEGSRKEPGFRAAVSPAADFAARANRVPSPGGTAVGQERKSVGRGGFRSRAQGASCPGRNRGRLSGFFENPTGFRVDGTRGQGSAAARSAAPPGAGDKKPGVFQQHARSLLPSWSSLDRQEFSRPAAASCLRCQKTIGQFAGTHAGLTPVVCMKTTPPRCRPPLRAQRLAWWGRRNRCGPRLSAGRTTTSPLSGARRSRENARRRTMDSQTADEMLAMFSVIQAIKDAIDRYEQGEVNIREAIGIIREATAGLRAA